MGSIVWLCVAGLALVSTPAWSQAGQQRPPDLTVAPNAPNNQTETRPAQNTAGRPANICQELVTYLEQQAAKKAEGSTQGGSQPAMPSQQPAQASQQPAPSGANPSAERTARATNEAPQSSGQTAPIPEDGKSNEPAPIAIEMARAMNDSKDLRGCQEATRRLRRAGIALPPSLLALAALRQDLLEKATAE